MNNSILVLDLAFRTGMAYFEDDKLISYGSIEKDKPKGNYDSKQLINSIEDLIDLISYEILKIPKFPTYIVVEQTNKGRNRYVQKTLEWIHHEFLKRYYNQLDKIYFIDTSEWRKLLDIGLSREQRRENAKINKHNRENPEDKIRGKVKVKHVGINYVNKKYGLKLLHKEDDEAEAILIGEAFIKIKNEIGLKEFYEKREQTMKTARREGTKRTKRRRARKAK